MGDCLHGPFIECYHKGLESSVTVVPVYCGNVLVVVVVISLFTTSLLSLQEQINKLMRLQIMYLNQQF